MKTRLIILFYLLCTALLVSAQKPIEFKKQSAVLRSQRSIKTAPRMQNPRQPQRSVSPQPADTSNVTVVYLEHADQMLYDEAQHPGAQLLEGNVCFRHDNAYLYCDSAYFYAASNSLYAFGNVRMEQGDTLFAYGDRIFYDGNRKMARLRNNVRMENRDVVLTTDSLNYDRLNNVGYYFNGGELHDNLNTLSSVFGYYYPEFHTAVFNRNVVGTNPDCTLNSDTLRYNTDTKLATILGPTTIVYNRETYIYSERGWYNTGTQQCMLLNNSHIQHASGKQLIADTIFYDRAAGKGEGFTNVELRDTTKHISLYGDYGYYIEHQERGMVTDSAMLTEYSGSDTLYLHADTLYTHVARYNMDTLPSDTLRQPNDTTYKIVQGYHNVRFYRADLQGVGDSMHYDTRDSVLHLLKDPILWTDTRQLTGDTMRIFMQGETVSTARVIGNAFACEKIDAEKYNQLSGKEIVGHIDHNTLRKIDVNGNAQSLYYPAEDDGTIIGLNLLESSYLYAYLDSQKLDRLVFWPSPSGSLRPLTQITKDDMYLANFSWQVFLRPYSKHDIFRRTHTVVEQSDSITNATQLNGGKRKTTRRAQREDDTQISNDKKTTSGDTRRPSGFGFGNSSSFGNHNGATPSGSNGGFNANLQGLGGNRNATALRKQTK